MDGAWVASGKPEVDVEDDEGNEGGEFIIQERFTDETAEVVEDSSLPLNPARQLTPMQTKLAQQAHEQHQILFVNHIDNSSFGV